ncbi:hypothetical protein AB0K14_07800 [Actinosynnema sp. NPDC050801]|uniref:hypothetical protein n=1 Tax=unclassified Actinosynnema TaxID=2637065 RepID=UPI00340A46EA
MPNDNRKLLGWSIVAAVLIILAALVVRTLLDSPEIVQGQAPTTTTRSSSTTTPPAGRTCDQVKSTDAGDQPVPTALLAQVRAIHEAACQADPRALLDILRTTPGHELPELTLEQLRTDPTAKAALALALETAPRPDQGGHTYCAPNGAAAVFGRGTLNRPGGITAFTTRPTPMTEGLCRV